MFYYFLYIISNPYWTKGDIFTSLYFIHDRLTGTTPSQLNAVNPGFIKLQLLDICFLWFTGSEVRLTGKVFELFFNLNFFDRRISNVDESQSAFQDIKLIFLWD